METTLEMQLGLGLDWKQEPSACVSEAGLPRSLPSHSSPLLRQIGLLCSAEHGAKNCSCQQVSVIMSLLAGKQPD